MNSRLLIIYGSQTGCAAEVAERIGREAKRRHFHPVVYAFDDYDIKALPNEELVVFVVATTGVGEVPDNMKTSWNFLLQRNLPPTALCKMNFSLFALGDSSYTLFNAAGRKLFKRLTQLGATIVCPRGEGDDQHRLGFDQGLEPWLEALWEELLSRHPLPAGVTVAPSGGKPCPRYAVAVGGDAFEEPVAAASRSRGPFSSARPYYATVKSNERITAPEHFQDVRHVVLRVDEEAQQALRHVPGDVVHVLPSTMPWYVDEMLETAGLDGDTVVTLVPNEDGVQEFKLPAHVHFPATLRNLFTHVFDITASPQRYFFEVMSFFASDEREKEQLERFASTEGQEDLYAYNQRQRRTVVEVLADFPLTRPPLDCLLDCLRRIQSRAFSISSAFVACPSEVHITMGVVEYQTKIHRPRWGLCSSWIASLEEGGGPVPMWIKPGSIRLPQDPATPVVMVGPGTGVAAFRAFVQHRRHQRASAATGDNQVFGPMVLIFGNRNLEGDFLHGEELSAAAEEGVLFKLITAFSRDQDRKVYVQHRMLEKEASAMIWAAVNAGGYFYISGNAKRMPIDVKDALRDILQQEGAMSEGDAHQYMLGMERNARLQTDTWF